jgi:hypothetical protein
MMGYRGSWEAYKEGATKVKVGGNTVPLNVPFMAKLMSNAIIPAMLHRAAQMGWLDGDDEEKPLQRFFKNIPEGDLASYFIIPTPRMDKLMKGELDFFDDNGKSLYAKLPKDELSRLAGGMAFMSLDGLAQEDKQSVMTTMDAFFNAADYAQGQAPGWNPFAKVVLAYGQLKAGGQPVDNIGQPIVPTRIAAMGMGSMEAKRALAIYAANSYGLGMVYRFKADRKAEGFDTTFEDVLDTPVLGPALSRFAKASDAGLYAQSWKKKEEMGQAEARKSYEQSEMFKDWWDKQIEDAKAKDSKEFPTTSQIKAYLKGVAATPQADGKTFPQLRKSFYNSIIPGLKEPGYSLLRSGTIEQKVEMLKDISEAKSPEEFKQFLESSRGMKFIGRDLRRAYRKSLESPQTQQD